jgi:tetratricopeptide (TPR) repeat protein
MLKRFATAIATLLVLLAPVATTHAQETAARETEWQNHKLPASSFVRHVDSSKTVMFRVPSEWKQQGSEPRFSGPEGVELRFIVEKISDGMPLQSYVAAVLQRLRNLPGGADSLTVRRTRLSGLESREIMFELNDERGRATRRLIWCTVDGPYAVTFVFIAPIAGVEVIEPYFKGVVQSAVIFGSATASMKMDLDYDDFESLRKSTLKESTPARIDEVQSLVSDLDGRDPAARARAVTRLASLFAASPDSAIDLVLENRPLARAAAVEAIAASGNKALDPFLFRAIGDRNSYVAARSASEIASRPNAVALIKSEIGLVDYTRLLRVATLLDEKSRIQIATELFAGSGGLSPFGELRAVPGKGNALPPPPPPPPPAAVRAPARKAPVGPPAPSGGTSPAARSKVINERMEVSGRVPGGIAGFPAGVEINPFALPTVNEHFIALNLIRGIPASNFTLPLAKIVARKHDGVTACALQIALARRERLPLEELFKLLSSSSPTVARYAAINLAFSASPSDIPRIESLAQKLSSEAKSPDKKESPDKKGGESKSELNLPDELRLAIARIRLKRQLDAADNQQSRSELVKNALADPKLAEWVWTEYTSSEFEDSRRSSTTAPTGAKESPQVSQLGENIFPRNVSLYVALPNPAAAFGKLNEGLNNLQTESARSQATLVLMFGTLREQLAKYLGAQPEGAILEQLGLKQDHPIALAKWTAEGAPAGLPPAERKAVLTRVNDRDRFEHLLALYQERGGNFAGLPEVVSAVARFLGFAPAALPMGALAVLKEGPPKSKPIESVKYKLIRRDQCLGYQVKVFERREITPEGLFTSNSIYLAYAGDAAVLTPDWQSLHDLLSRLRDRRSYLAENAEFNRAVATGGDAIYMSNLGALFSPSKKSGGDVVTESGALKISKTAWESFYQLSFDNAGWAILFAPFQAKGLASPRELLPASTVGYVFARPDFPALWREWRTELFNPDTTKGLTSFWAFDFEKEIVPELGPECGAALLGLPKIEDSNFNAPWIVFFKLKSDKLSRAFTAGKLFKESPAANQAAKLKLGSRTLVSAVKNGYLIFAGSEAALEQLDQKDKLDGVRDFIKAAEQTTHDVVAFGGYSLQSAIAELSKGDSDPVKALIMNTASSISRAFHSQNFSATKTPQGLDARLSVSLDREGRYSVAELQSKSNFGLTFAVIEARGVPIASQQRIETLKLRIRTKAAGVAERIAQDISSPHQLSEKKSTNELVVAVRPRQTAPARKIQLSEIPKDLEPFLASTGEIRSDDQTVKSKALEIAGADREAWSVAQKLSEWTYKNLKWKRVDSADAAQTLATREADCLEFSQLFVAMSRSLGLPARIVSGMAYGGGSFGGHAWVEVWAGEWIELDPTWGTDFVDATHIRTASSELINYAALNLIEFEVLEAPRTVPEFQRDATKLVEKICEDLTASRKESLELALDVAQLTDEHMGAGSWLAMTDRERDQMSSAYRRLVSELTLAFRRAPSYNSRVRLVSVTQSGDRASALAVSSYATLVRFTLARRAGVWTLIDIVYPDSGYRAVSESLQPVIQTILTARAGKHPVRSSMSPQTQILFALQAVDSTEDRIEEALRVADKALKEDPKNQTLRHLKALCLSAEDDPKKTEEALAMWQQLSGEDPPFAPSLLSLADHFQSEGSEDSKRAIELLNRYAELVPDNPQPHGSLAGLYETEGDLPSAEAARRAEIARDPRETDHYTDLAELMVVQKRYQEACSVIDEGAKHGSTADELFADLFLNLSLNEREDGAEALAAAMPERLNRNADALVTLADMRITSERARDALPLVTRALKIAPDKVEAHNTLAMAYRKLSKWRPALAAADAAIKLDAEDGDAHYNRACALSRLGRKRAALSSLKRAIELDEDWLEYLAEEDDLKPLAQLPEFKKLIPVEEKK